MPDWSYHTIFKPLLFRLPAKRARAVTLGAMGLLARLPGGRLTIRTLGHMEVSPELAAERWGVRLGYPVGLGGGLDVHGTGHRALSQLGFGFVEVGPITPQPIAFEGDVLRDRERETIIYPSADQNDGVDRIERRLRREAESNGGGSKLPVFARIKPQPGCDPAEQSRQIEELAGRISPHAAGLIVDLSGDWPAAGLEGDDCEPSSMPAQAIDMAAIRRTAGGKPLLLYVPADMPLARAFAGCESALRHWEGFVIGEGVHADGKFEVGRTAQPFASARLAELAAIRRSDQAIFVSGGIHEPADAIDCLERGADFVMLHSGFVYSGPGLPKRVNEAILAHRETGRDRPQPPSFWSGWGWMGLLGIGMIVGGLLAWYIALTTVLLPYDERFLGMSGAEVASRFPALFHFMSHDRISLAGTMVSIGVLYSALSVFGLRRRLHWAKTALAASASVGFASFFLYLGYGYLDPLHALAAAVLFPLFMLGIRSKADRPLAGMPNMRNSREWKLALWGQLMFVMLGAALAVGGLTIAAVGITDVFVRTDLTFLNSSAAELNMLSDRFIPLIAHDRAGFGGALFSDAIALLAIALWGIAEGSRWLWWTLLIGGFPALYAGLGVHVTIGYTDFVHLLPLYVAILLYAAGLLLLYPYMMSGGGTVRRSAG